MGMGSPKPHGESKQVMKQKAVPKEHVPPATADRKPQQQPQPTNPKNNLLQMKPKPRAGFTIDVESLDEAPIVTDYLGDLEVTQVFDLLNDLTNTNRAVNSLNNIRKVLNNCDCVRIEAGFRRAPMDPNNITDADREKILRLAESQITSTPEKAFADPDFVHLILIPDNEEEEGGAE